MDEHLKKWLSAFYQKACPGEQEVLFEPLAGDGSVRVFWRVRGESDAKTFVAVSNPPLDEDRHRENQAYFMIGKHLFYKGIPLPEIYEWDLDRGWFIMADLGNQSLQDAVAHEADPVAVYERVIECLISFQVEGIEDFDPAWCCQTHRYNRTVMRRYESDYFQKAFLKAYLGIEKPLPELENAFDYLAEKASAADTRFLMHRDFQSRNIMVRSRRIGFIDWQGSRPGPLAYDLASLLIDPYTNLTDPQKQRIYDHYVSGLRDRNLKGVSSFDRDYHYLALQRNLQILGAFSFLTKVRKKPGFEPYIPAAVSSLKALLEPRRDTHLKPLKRVVEEITQITTDYTDSAD